MELIHLELINLMWNRPNGIDPMSVRYADAKIRTKMVSDLWSNALPVRRRGHTESSVTL